MGIHIFIKSYRMYIKKKKIKVIYLYFQQSLRLGEFLKKIYEYFLSTFKCLHIVYR